MRITVLSPIPERMCAFLARSGAHDVTVTAQPLPPEHAADWLISYNYRHILRGPVLDRHRGRALNLHSSWLPWNRGASPNFWSWFDDTPKGVSIHQIDAGIDTGELLAQREVQFGRGSTLRTSYDDLQAAMLGLFEEVWGDIAAGRALPKRQSGRGSYHNVAASQAALEGLVDGFDTPVRSVQHMGRVYRAQGVPVLQN